MRRKRWARYRRGRGASKRRWRALRFHTLVSVLMECGALMAEMRRREALEGLEEMEAGDRRVGEFQAGDRVVLRGRALYSMGLMVGELGGRVWTVVQCSCGLCQLGQHVVANDGGEPRHFARAAVRLEGQACVDELRAEDSDALTAGIGRGMRQAARGRL